MKVYLQIMVKVFCMSICMYCMYLIFLYRKIVLFLKSPVLKSTFWSQVLSAVHVFFYTCHYAFFQRYR